MAALDDIASIVDIGSSLFGSVGKQSGSQSGTSTTTGTTTERLNLDEAAIQSIIQEVLGGAGGLASIFSGEQSSGIFNSSVAAQQAGDLASKLVGEIARLTAEKETKVDTETKSTSKSKTKTKDGGLFGAIKGIF